MYGMRRRHAIATLETTTIAIPYATGGSFGRTIRDSNAITPATSDPSASSPSQMRGSTRRSRSQALTSTRRTVLGVPRVVVVPEDESRDGTSVDVARQERRGRDRQEREAPQRQDRERRGQRSTGQAPVVEEELGEVVAEQPPAPAGKEATDQALDDQEVGERDPERRRRVPRHGREPEREDHHGHADRRRERLRHEDPEAARLPGQQRRHRPRLPLGADERGPDQPSRDHEQRRGPLEEVARDEHRELARPTRVRLHRDDHDDQEDAEQRDDRERLHEPTRPEAKQLRA